jgi:hypothetical protein
MSTYPKLQLGSRSPFVTELQNLLNTKLRPSPRLVPDGSFGSLTNAAVRRFQQDNWLVVDGVVGDCTWNALRDSEDFNVSVRVSLVPQPTDDTCWAAATGMLLGRAAPVSAPPGMGTAGGIANDSDLQQPTNTAVYNAHYGLTLLPGQSWMPTGLAALIRVHGALLVNTLWDVDGYTRPDPTAPGRYVGSSGHYRIFSGIRGTSDPFSTTLRIYDPWRPKHGAIYSVNYARLMQRYPATTYQISYR